MSLCVWGWVSGVETGKDVLAAGLARENLRTFLAFNLFMLLGQSDFLCWGSSDSGDPSLLFYRLRNNCAPSSTAPGASSEPAPWQPPHRTSAGLVLVARARLGAGVQEAEAAEVETGT